MCRERGGVPASKMDLRKEQQMASVFRKWKSPSLAFSLRLSCFNQHGFFDYSNQGAEQTCSLHRFCLRPRQPHSALPAQHWLCGAPLQPLLLPILIVAASPSLQSMPFSSVCDADHAYALRQRGAFVCKAPLDSLLSHVHFYCDIACACGVQVQF